MRDLSRFVAVLEAAVVPSKPLRALSAPLVCSSPLLSPLLGLDLPQQPVEVFLQHTLVRLPKLLCAALRLRSRTNEWRDDSDEIRMENKTY